jgi:hypothetical protein
MDEKVRYITLYYFFLSFHYTIKNLCRISLEINIKSIKNEMKNKLSGATKRLTILTRARTSATAFLAASTLAIFVSYLSC